MSSEPRYQDNHRAGIVIDPVRVEVERTLPHDDGTTERFVESYDVRAPWKLNILGIFREIYFHHDPTFGFRNFECGRGVCSTCNVMYEGRVQKGCRILIEPGSEIRIGPQSPDTALRDVACSLVGDAVTEDEK